MRVVRVGGCLVGMAQARDVRVCSLVHRLPVFEERAWKQLLAFSLSSIFIKMSLRVERLWKGLLSPWSFALFTLRTSHSGVLVFIDRC